LQAAIHEYQVSFAELGVTALGTSNQPDYTQNQPDSTNRKTLTHRGLAATREPLPSPAVV
jgi:hypothetical protein